MAGPPDQRPPETVGVAASSSPTPYYQEWILDTIDSLRSRKARPDLERICRMMRRRHGLEPEHTCVELEKLILQRGVLRVSYKDEKAGEEPGPEKEKSKEEKEVSALSEGFEVSKVSSGQRQLNGETAQQAKNSRKEQSRDWSPLALLKGKTEGQQLALGDGTPKPFPVNAVKKEGRAASASSGLNSPLPESFLVGKPTLTGACRTPTGYILGKRAKASDPMEWTVMDVVEYFTKAGFPEQASAFQEQVSPPLSHRRLTGNPYY
ncbi:atherin-like isoform X2 [Tachyglossus aculeatus]|uniref:atherin-like isoform X2 n=1 Tax=Tachyglossus aculeatus TaxID=9261 RepID=UPI0018F4AFA4|nr:atherin-like isoform X2 [Tachyglossus aculeatus]